MGFFNRSNSNKSDRMNKVEIGLAMILIAIVCYIGCLIYYEMAVEIENNPDIKDIGGPPVITDLRSMVVTIGVAVIFIFIVLKMGVKDENKRKT